MKIKKNKMVEWYKVEDKLPEDEKLYLCWTKSDYGNGVGVGFYTDKISKEYNGEKRWVIAGMINENVVAWADFNYYEG